MSQPDQQTLDTLLEALHGMAAPEVTIDRDTDLVQQVGLDSVQVMDLVMQIEDDFDVVVPVNQLADVRTPGQLAALVETLKKDG